MSLKRFVSRLFPSSKGGADSSSLNPSPRKRDTVVRLEAAILLIKEKQFPSIGTPFWEMRRLPLLDIGRWVVSFQDEGKPPQELHLLLNDKSGVYTITDLSFRVKEVSGEETFEKLSLTTPLRVFFLHSGAACREYRNRTDDKSYRYPIVDEGLYTDLDVYLGLLDKPWTIRNPR